MERTVYSVSQLIEINTDSLKRIRNDFDRQMAAQKLICAIAEALKVEEKPREKKVACRIT